MMDRSSIGQTLKGRAKLYLGLSLDNLTVEYNLKVMDDLVNIPD